MSLWTENTMEYDNTTVLVSQIILTTSKHQTRELTVIGWCYILKQESWSKLSLDTLCMVPIWQKIKFSLKLKAGQNEATNAHRWMKILRVTANALVSFSHAWKVPMEVSYPWCYTRRRTWLVRSYGVPKVHNRLRSHCSGSLHNNNLWLRIL